MGSNYQKFEPTSDWIQDQDSDTLLLDLPGYEKKHLRVQLTQTRKLIVSGERPMGDNTWSRFRKQFAVSDNCDVNGISAKLDAGVLFIRLPKLIIPAAVIAEQLQKPKTTTDEPPKSPELPQNSTQKVTTPVIKPPENEKKNDELQNNDRKSSGVANQLGLLEEEEMRKKNDEKISELANLSKTTPFGGENNNNYYSREEIGSARNATEVKKWRKMVLIVVLLMIVLGVYFNNVKATWQSFGLP